MTEALKIDFATIVVRGDVVADEIDGEVVMASLEQGDYFGLNTVGSYIWELLEQPRSVAALCEAVLETFEVDRETCEGHVLAFLTELADEKLVRVGGRGPAA